MAEFFITNLHFIMYLFISIVLIKILYRTWKVYKFREYVMKLEVEFHLRELEFYKKSGFPDDLKFFCIYDKLADFTSMLSSNKTLKLEFWMSDKDIETLLYKYK